MVLEPNDDVIVNDTDDSVTIEDTQDTADSSTETDVQTEVDDDGVEYKNRYFETQRKLQNIEQSLPQLIQEGVEQALGKVAPQSDEKYSMDDYKLAMRKDPENADFYLSKIDELRQADIKKTIQESLSSFRQEQQADDVKRNAEAWAYQNFPQLRDPNSDFTRNVLAEYNARPAQFRAPHDFALAAELVAGRMGVKPISQNSGDNAKITKQQRDLKKLTKERSLEGDGRASIQPNRSSRKRDDLKAGLAKGNVTDYFKKYYVKTSEG